MSGIGNAEEARFILDWVEASPKHYGRSQVVWDEEAPEGWEFIGSGSFRSVWLSPSGVAYKVQHSYGYSSMGNQEEYSNWDRATRCEIPDNVRLPSLSLFTVRDEPVVAMERVCGPRLYDYKGEGRGDLYEALREAESEFALGDLHDENAIVDQDGLLVPVDFGG